MSMFCHKCVNQIPNDSDLPTLSDCSPDGGGATQEEDSSSSTQNDSSSESGDGTTSNVTPADGGFNDLWNLLLVA
ncbi:hypothetical protein [Bifidobacterium callitrichidarum]|uniref:hypothetical protein n=1 Tax=Bifidobacterium callitrichidarum TaxID=2052941 RepID=UPI0011B2869A|nr:hypothetical protein [Bifidobacterium callitrichidarum]